MRYRIGEGFQFGGPLLHPQLEFGVKAAYLFLGPALFGHILHRVGKAGDAAVAIQRRFGTLMQIKQFAVGPQNAMHQIERHALA